MGISGYMTWEKEERRENNVVAVEVEEDMREKDVYINVDMCRVVCCLYGGK